MWPFRIYGGQPAAAVVTHRWDLNIFFLLTHLTHSLAFFTRMTTAMMAARHAGEKESFVSFFEWSFLVLLFLFNKKLQTKLESSERTWHFFQVEKKNSSHKTHTHTNHVLFLIGPENRCVEVARFSSGWLFNGDDDDGDQKREGKKENQANLCVFARFLRFFGLYKIPLPREQKKKLVENCTLWLGGAKKIRVKK